MDAIRQLSAMGEAFQRLLAQDTRLLELAFPSDGGIPRDKLLADRLCGWEEVNVGFRYEVEALSDDAFLELKRFAGLPVRLSILAAGGGRRLIHGVITEVRSEGSDGALASYRLVVEPVTAALKLGRSSRVFLGKSYVEVALQLLREQVQANAVFGACFELDNRCRSSFPPREFIFLNGESPWDFVRRCLAKEGVSFVFAPVQDGSDGTPRHALVLFSDPQDLDLNEAGSARFHRADGTEERDAITVWHARRTLQCGRVVRRSWNHAAGSLGTPAEDLRSNQGPYGNALAATIEEYRHETPLEHDDAEMFAARTALRAQVREQRTKGFAGEGTVREFRAGSRFTLAEHPVHEQDAPGSQTFVLTRVELEAENNLPKGLGNSAEANRRVERAYRNRFTCLRSGIPILPEELSFPPFGYQTATVVGPGSEAVHTDEVGRIRIRLHATRAEDHPEAGASGTDKDSFWVRVLQPWSSRGMGGNLLPRVGDEVLVSALHDDPDKLVVLGVLPGGTRRPGRFSECSDLPGDRAVSGLRSREHGGRRGSQFLFDDTPGEVRAQFSSDHACSELNLGYLTAPRSRGVARARGEGAELRTDGSAAIRAARGLLLSAATQFRAEGPQLARQELAQLLESFRSLTESLGAYAGEHHGLKAGMEGERQLEERVEAWETGTNTRPGTRPPAEGQRLIALSAPDGLIAATPGTGAIYAGENLALAAQRHGHFTAGQQLLVNAGKGLSLFSQSGGFKAIAHQDDLEAEAQHGDIALTAAKSVKILASENEVLIAASRKLTLMCGGSYLTLSADGLVCGGPAFTGKVGRVSWPGPDRKRAALPACGDGRTRRRFQYLFEATGAPIRDADYTIQPEGQGPIKGKTDQDGCTAYVEPEFPEFLEGLFQEEGTHGQS